MGWFIYRIYQTQERVIEKYMRERENVNLRQFINLSTAEMIITI
jgi:hypothetical protein